MKALLLPALLVLVAACSQPRKPAPDKAAMPAGATAAEVEAVYEVRDKASQACVGLVRKRIHGDGQVVFWVNDNHGETRGFILENNRAYKYEWTVGRRSRDPVFIGADTISAGARQVLGYEHPVTMEPTTLRALQAEHAPKKAPAKAAPAEAPDEGCGCGDE